MTSNPLGKDFSFVLYEELDSQLTFYSVLNLKLLLSTRLHLTFLKTIHRANKSTFNLTFTLKIFSYLILKLSVI